MKIRKIYKSVIFALCLIPMVLHLKVTHANDMKFGVFIIPPENQRDNITGYFDMLMEPGSEQLIEIEITSVSDETIIVIVDMSSASTDSGGFVHYKPQKGREGDYDESLPFAFEDIASIETARIELGPRETIRVPIRIKMPEEEFNGVIAGGLGISKEIDLEAIRAETNEMFINVFSFEVPVIIRQNETVLLPDLLLLDAYASQRNWRNIVAAHLQNPEMMFINQMSIYARVTPAGSNETLFEHFVESRQVAPNSNFVFGIPLNGERFTSGDFLLHMEVDSNNGRWSFVRDFHITPEQARALNETDVSIQRISLWVFIAIGGAILLAVSITYMTMLKRKAKKTANEAVDEIMSRM